MLTAVALSGGADSLSALSRVRAQGDKAIAVHAFFLPPEDQDRWKTDQLQKLCSLLDVRLVTLDLSAEFAQEIIHPFMAAYKNGLTPNPCSLCNRRIKFKLLLKHCLDLGAERMATGHYARLVRGSLWRGKDPAKDQSYFLSLTEEKNLRRAVFPLGESFKHKIVFDLRKQGLTPVQRNESQEICFIPGDYRDFLRRNCPDLGGPGPIIGPGGERLGTHRGLWAYTPGQRRGLGVAYRYPLYVLDKDPAENALIVGAKEDLAVSGCMVRAPNFLVPPENWPDTVWIQTRYRQTSSPARVLEISKKRMRISFIHPQKKPAPGQTAAIYSEKGQVLAGAVIANEIP
ncbi:MAG: tRNA 2-thiouridine(34) synthase MnmA [Desulfonatronovibrionaceae bacterium]